MLLTTENIILIGALLLLVSVFAGKVAYRFGAPALLLFLGVGMLFGLRLISFNSAPVAQFVGMVALCIILFSGGMDTRYRAIRPVIGPGVVLATVGVALTALIVAGFVYVVAPWCNAEMSFPLALPQTLPDGYTFDSASDQFGMAVVVYADAEGHTLKYCMGKGEDALTGMNHTVSGEKLEGTDALLYAETGYTAVEWKDSKYSYCFIADESFDTAVWQALVNSIK